MYVLLAFPAFGSEPIQFATNILMLSFLFITEIKSALLRLFSADVNKNYTQTKKTWLKIYNYDITSVSV